MSRRRTGFVHPAAIVESTEIGQGTRVWAFAHVMKGAKVGEHCNIGEHAFLESGVKVGDHVVVKNGAMLWSGVTVGDGVFIGPGVMFTNDRRPRARRWPRLALSDSPEVWRVPTVVEEGASLGASTTLVSGITVGAYALVGAGSVVTASIPPYGFGYGVPFRLRGFVCSCGIRVPRAPRRGAACPHRGASR